MAQVFLDRYRSNGTDDAYALHALISTHSSEFSEEFIEAWRNAYNKYCQTKENIELRQGRDV